MDIIIADAIQALEQSKNIEAQAKRYRLEMEGVLIGLIENEKDEGSKTESSETVSITVTNGLTRICDFDELIELDKQLPDHLKIVNMKPSLNIENMRVLEKTAGENFKLSMAKAITVKPKKPSVTIKRKK